MLRRAAALLGCALLPAACAAPIGPIGPPGPATLYVIDRGWHSDIGLPAAEVTEPLASLEGPFPGVRFLVFGFGERTYYMSHRPTSGESLRALLPSKSALLMTALSASPQAAFGASHVVRLYVSHAGMANVQAAIWQTLERRPGGKVAPLAPGPYPGSVFYAAHGTYDAFNTCNTWTAAMLHAAGLPVSTAGVMFAGQVMGMARRIAAQQASMRGDG